LKALQDHRQRGRLGVFCCGDRGMFSPLDFFGDQAYHADAKSAYSLFHINVAPESSERAGSYDVTADGTRFVVNANGDENHPAPITLVLNWTAELKKK
jgi:hypothetical protein